MKKISLNPTYLDTFTFTLLKLGLTHVKNIHKQVFLVNISISSRQLTSQTNSMAGTVLVCCHQNDYICRLDLINDAEELQHPANSLSIYRSNVAHYKY